MSRAIGTTRLLVSRLATEDVLQIDRDVDDVGAQVGIYVVHRKLALALSTEWTSHFIKKHSTIFIDFPTNLHEDSHVN